MSTTSGPTGYLPAVGALSAAIAILTGAFGAHGLKEQVSMEYLSVWETAAQYHLFHSLALFVASRNLGSQPGILQKIPSYCFGVGMLFFSGSLYALVLTGAKWLGPITPLGGLILMSGWVVLAWNHRPRKLPSS